MIFTKLSNGTLVNSISLLYIKPNIEACTIEYTLDNRKVLKDKFDNLEAMFSAYEAIDTEGLIVLSNGCLLNAEKVEQIENPTYDKSRIEYSFGVLGKITEKYETIEEGITAFEDIAVDNYIAIDSGLLVSPLFVDGLEKDPVNEKGISYTLNSGRTVKEFFEDSSEADSKLETSVTTLEEFEYTAPAADSRNFLKIASVKPTEGGDNVEDYYKNMDELTISQEGNNVVKVIATSPLISFINSANINGAWYGILLDLGIARDNVKVISGYKFESNETNAAECQKWGATGDNEFILWLNGAQAGNREIIFGAKDNSVRPTPIVISFSIDSNLKEKMATAEVSNLEELKSVMVDNTIKTVNLTQDIGNIGEEIQFLNPVTFNGNNHKLTFTSTGRNLIFLKPSIVNDLTVEGAATDSWSSTYMVQVYDGQGYQLNNCTLTKGNAGLLVNGASAVIDNLNVSGNTFGGIEVSKGVVATIGSKLTINGTLTNTTEEYGKPTVWIDGENDGNSVVGKDLFENSEVKVDQIQYYLVEENSITPETTEDSEEAEINEE